MKKYALIIPILLMIFFLFPSVSEAATFGYTTIGVSTSFYYANRVEGSFFTVPENGTLTKITAYHNGGSSASKGRGVIFLKSDGSVIAYGSETAIGVGAAWYDRTLNSGSLSITSGLDYWITVWEYGTNAEDANYDAETDKGVNAALTYHATNPPSSIGASPTLQSLKFSIYATYTASVSQSSPPNPNLILQDSTLIIQDGQIIIQD